MTWSVDGTRYAIRVTNPQHRCAGVATVTLDGAAVDPRALPLVNDGQLHEIEVVLGTDIAMPVQRASRIA